MVVPTKPELIASFAHHARAHHASAEAFADAAVDALGVNRTDQRCLEIIERSRADQRQPQLAAAAGLSAKTITTAIDRLERAGYARRVADSHDRRRVLVVITDDGHRRGEAVYAPLVQASRQMLVRYSRADLEVIVDYLDHSRLGCSRPQAARLHTTTSPPAGSLRQPAAGYAGS